MNYTRRELGKMALAAVPAARLIGDPLWAAQAAATKGKPNSDFNGVRVGIISPGSFHGSVPGGTSPESILNALTELGVSYVELESSSIEPFIGVPGQVRGGTGGGGGGNGGGGGGRARGPSAPLTPEQIAAQQAARDEARRARLAMPMEKVKAIKKMYDNGGVDIELIKFPNMGAPDWTDAEIDYVFNVARTLGARGITCEPMPAAVEASKRLAKFAEKHRIVVAYHGHVAVADPDAFSRPGSWEQAFFYSKYNWANIDIGHYTVANKVAPIDFLREYHDRILNVHVKDRKIETAATVPFGEGDSKLAEIVQMMKREKWTFQATIEIEYPVAPGQYMAEHAKCVKFIMDAAA